jgi:hypothetical protein
VRDCGGVGDLSGERDDNAWRRILPEVFIVKVKKMGDMILEKQFFTECFCRQSANYILLRKSPLVS